MAVKKAALAGSTAFLLFSREFRFFEQVNNNILVLDTSYKMIITIYLLYRFTRFKNLS